MSWSPLTTIGLFLLAWFGLSLLVAWVMGRWFIHQRECDARDAYER